MEKIPNRPSDTSPQLPLLVKSRLAYRIGSKSVRGTPVSISGSIAYAGRALQLGRGGLLRYRHGSGDDRKDSNRLGERFQRP